MKVVELIYPLLNEPPGQVSSPKYSSKSSQVTISESTWSFCSSVLHQTLTPSLRRWMETRAFMLLVMNLKDESNGFSEYKRDVVELEGFVDWKGRPARKDRHGGQRSAIFVYVMTMLDSLAYVGMVINLVTYFTMFMHMDIAEAANTTTNFMGTTFLLALVAGVFSDTTLNRFKTSVLNACLQFIGYLILLIQAHYGSLKPPTCNPLDPTSICVKVNGAKIILLHAGLYVLAIGSGGTKAVVAPFGADQFDERDPDERGKISSYFNMNFLAVTIGSTLGVTVLVWVQNNKGWDAGFGISAGAIFLGMICIVLGYSTYRHRTPEGSPLTRIVKVLVASFNNRKLKVSDESNDLYEPNDKEAAIYTHKLQHTNQFKFLDKAATLSADSFKTENKMEHSPWFLCTVTQVEETKILVRIFPIFASAVLMNTCVGQLQTFTVAQGLTMDRSMGKNFQIPAASLAVIPLVFIVIITPLYDRFLVPLARKITGHETGISSLQRIGVGLVLASVSMAMAALVEVKRKNVAREKGMLDAVPLFSPPIPMTVFWLGFPYFIFGFVDLFTFVGLMEFFYSEAPAGMRSLATAFSWTSLALGYFLSGVLVNIVNAATRMTKSHGWLAGNNLNRNHLDLFYWVLAILNILNFVNYLFWAR
ncbi:hypothetical protein KI387_017471, partial [Taxus chinensis]